MSDVAKDLVEGLEAAVAGEGREKFMSIDSVQTYGGLAIRTLAADVADGSITMTFPPEFAMVMNAATGIASEAGEINEIVKKRFFHHHPHDDASKIHMAKELGDLAWYFNLMCRAYGLDPAQVLALNIEKLRARYPQGFEVARSIHRDPNDI